MNLSQRTIKAGSWQLAAVVTRAGLQLLVLAVLARYVLPKEFGYIAMANMVLVFVEMLAEAGIGPAIIQKKDLQEEHIRAGFVLAVILGIIFVSLIWICAPTIAKFFKTESLVNIIRWIGLSVFITKLSMVSRSRFERELRFDILMWIDIISYIIGYAIVGIFLAVRGYGVWAIVAGKLTQCCIQTIILLIKKPICFKLSFSFSAYKDLLTYGGGLTLVRVFDNISSQGDYFIIGRFLGSVPLGFYERASSLMAMPGQYLGFVLDKTLFPAMSQIQDQSKRLENAYFLATNIISMFLIPISVLMITLAPEIIVTVLGPNWSESVLLFQILSITLFLRIFINLTDTLVRATGAVYASAVRRAIYAITIIFFCWVGQFRSLIHIAIAMNLAVLIGYVLMIHLGIKIIKFKLIDYLKILINGVIIGVIMFLFIFPIVTVLRLYIDHSLLILCIVLFCSSLLMIFMLLSFPKLLGRSGLEFIQNIIQVLPNKFKNNYTLLSLKKKISKA